MNLKEVYNQNFLEDLSKSIIDFDQKKFLKITSLDWQEKSLKERMRAISRAIDICFIETKNYQKKIEILKLAVNKISKNKNSSLALIIFADFIEVFGLDDFDFSMNALAFFTEFGSAEFAVRVFIKKNEKKAISFLKKWAISDNFHIRRLASECCRPRLPWGFALENFKKNPQEILPILELLKNDQEKYVKKSIANNLNDISKDHPKIVLETLKRWKKEKIDLFIIKHALRTLLKQGNSEALEIIGIKKQTAKNNQISITKFSLNKESITQNEKLIFSFWLKNNLSKTLIRIEYAIYFLRKNCLHNKKVFQITTKNFDKGVFNFAKTHSFCDLSTRRHYKGEHFVSIIVNGVEFDRKKIILF